MTVTINGKLREVPEGTTVATLVAQLGYAPGRIAVERNRNVVTKASYADVAIVDGDELEIVGFVGGG